MSSNSNSEALEDSGWKQMVMLLATGGVGAMLLLTSLAGVVLPGIFLILAVVTLRGWSTDRVAVDGADSRGDETAAQSSPPQCSPTDEEAKLDEATPFKSSSKIAISAEAIPPQPAATPSSRHTELLATATGKPSPTTASTQSQQQASEAVTPALADRAASVAAAPVIQQTPTRGLVPEPTSPTPEYPETRDITNEATKMEASLPPKALTGGAAILARLRKQRSDTAPSVTPAINTAAVAASAARSPPSGLQGPAASKAASQVPVTILYGSQTGTCMEIARNLAAEALEKGFNASCASLNELGFAALSLPRTPMVVVISSSTGDGDPPDNATSFFAAMRRKPPPGGPAPPLAPLAGVRFTVLGLGDSNYTRFMYVPRAIKSRLAELGAVEFYKCAEADEVEGVENIVDPWTEGLWAALSAAIGQAAVAYATGAGEIVQKADSEPATKHTAEAAEKAAAEEEAKQAAEVEVAAIGEAATEVAATEAAAVATAAAAGAEKANAGSETAQASAKAAEEAEAAAKVAQAAEEAAKIAQAAEEAAKAAQAVEEAAKIAQAVEEAAKAAQAAEEAAKVAQAAEEAAKAARAAEEAAKIAQAVEEAAKVAQAAEEAAKVAQAAEEAAKIAQAVEEAAKAAQAAEEAAKVAKAAEEAAKVAVEVEAAARAAQAAEEARQAGAAEGAAKVMVANREEITAATAKPQPIRVATRAPQGDASETAAAHAGAAAPAVGVASDSLLPNTLVSVLDAGVAPTAASVGLPTIAESRVFEDSPEYQPVAEDGEQQTASVPPTFSDGLAVSLTSSGGPDGRPATGTSVTSSVTRQTENLSGTFRRSMDMTASPGRQKPPSRLQAKPTSVNFPKREDTVVKRKDEMTYGMLMGLAPVGVDIKGVPALLPCRLKVVWEKDEMRCRQVRVQEGTRPTLEERHRVDPEGIYTVERPFWAHISGARYETAFWSDRKVIHLELSICGSNIAYHPGDSVGVLPVNQPDLVTNLCKRLHLHPDKVFSILPATGGAENGGGAAAAEGGEGGSRVASHIPSPCSVGYALSHCLDITSVTRKSVLRLLAEHAADAAERRTLMYLSSKSPGGREAYSHEVGEHQPSLLDLLVRFRSVNPPWDALLDALPPLMPRMYSISSSQKDPAGGPEHLSVALSIVRFKTRYGTRLGVATTWLDRVAAPWTVEGAALPEQPVHLPVFLRRTADFKPPPSLATPLIMVGPGTGVAPFRGFLQERRADIATQKPTPGSLGEAVLFFGCRREDEDYLYREELEAFKAEGTLSALHVAFSRAQADKVYVQDMMKQQGEKVWALLEAGAHIYVCGDGAAMAKDVNAALVVIAQQHGSMNEADAATFLQNLSQERRYVRDIWS